MKQYSKLPIFLRTLCLTLLFAFTLAAGTATAQTDETKTLFFNVADGKFYTDTNGDGTITDDDDPYTGQTDKYEWNGTSQTLTLKGFTWETSAQTAFQITGALTIYLQDGTVNTFTSTYSGTNSGMCNGILTNSSLTIQGDGTLNATGGTVTNSYSNGINGNVTIKGGTVNATGGRAAANRYSNGINGNVTINGGIVNATGGETETEGRSNGIYGNGTIKGGTVNATGGTATYSFGINSGMMGINVCGGTLVAKGNT